MSVNPLRQDWTSAQVEVMEHLGEWAWAFAELNQHLGTWTGLPTTDAVALGQVTWAAESGHPLSPVELSRRTGLSSGATSALVDRLERAGHVSRSRESADRRRVSLRPSVRARRRVQEFLAVAGTETAAALAASDPAELEVVTAFLRRMSDAATEGTRRLASRRT